jgi:hypothetical protein
MEKGKEGKVGGFPSLKITSSARKMLNQLFIKKLVNV